MSGSNLTEGGGGGVENTPRSAAPIRKSPVLLGLTFGNLAAERSPVTVLSSLLYSRQIYI